MLGDHDMAARDLIRKRTLYKVRALLVGRLGGLYGCWFNAWRVETGECPKNEGNAYSPPKSGQAIRAINPEDFLYE